MVSKVGIIVELDNSSEVYIRKQQEDFTLSDDIGNQILLSKEDWKGVIEHLQTFINQGGYEEHPLADGECPLFAPTIDVTRWYDYW